jgi:hypothetical protein
MKDVDEYPLLVRLLSGSGFTAEERMILGKELLFG